MDLDQLFWEIDDFWRDFEPQWKRSMLPAVDKKRHRASTLSMSEVMTIIVNFHASSYRNFKHYYLKEVMPHLRSSFPKLVSYNRFVELKKAVLIPLLCYLHTRKGEGTGISFIDATFIDVCQPTRAKRHRVFEKLAQWGKNAIKWHFGFKLHLLINEHGDLLGFQLTSANVDDRKPVPELLTGIIGKLFGDKGYISGKLFQRLLEQDLQLITPIKKNMKNRLMPMIDKVLLRKRSLIETVNDQLKNISQIEHSRHRSVFNFGVNLIAGLIAYTYQEKKPSLNLSSEDLEDLKQLSAAVF